MTDTVPGPWDLAQTRKIRGVYVPATGEFQEVGGEGTRQETENT